MNSKKQILSLGGEIKYRDISTGNFPEWSIMAGGGGTGNGDMLKSTYDTNDDGKVDTAENAEKLGGILANQFVQTSDSRLSDARSASDVSAWAKAATKPTYTASEVGAPSGSGTSTGTNTGDQDLSGLQPKETGKGLVSTDITSRISYNPTEDTISYKRTDGGTTEFGKEIVDTYTNIGTVDIVNGDIVSIVGATGDRSAVKLTDASDSALSLSTIGMCTVPMIQQNNSGVICKLGKVHGLNTIDYAEGTMLYVSPIFKGKWTSVKPASGYIIQIGVVVVSHSSEGVVDLHVQVIPQAVDIITDSTHRFVTDTEKSTWGAKQDALVSGTNIKTINGSSVVGSGDITISAGGAGSDTTAIHKDASNEYSSVTEKTTLAGDDIALIEDSESSFSKKKWRLSSVKTYLQTAFNSVYSLVSDQGDRHGFYNASNSSLSFDNTTRTFTITPTNPYIIYINGSKYNITINKVVSFTNTAGQWFITFSISDGTPILNATQTPWSLLDLTQIPVAIISWNGVSGRILDERHSSKRNLVWHDSEHNSVGARYRNGFTSITPTSSNTFSLSSGVIADEDIILDTGGAQTTCQIMYRNSGLTFMTWDASSAAYIKTGANGRPVYDNSGVLTEIANNNYAVYYLTMTNCIEPGKKIVSIIAQSQYASLTAAQASSIPILLANVAEWKYLYRIIVKASANGFTYIESNPLYNLTTGLAISSGTVTSVSASSVTLTPFNGITETNVQAGLEQENAKAIHKDTANEYSTITEKTTFANADVFLMEDSEAGYGKKKWLFSSLKTALNLLYKPSTYYGEFKDEFLNIADGNVTVALKKSMVLGLSGVAGADLTSANNITFTLPTPIAGEFNQSVIYFKIGATIPTINHPANTLILGTFVPNSFSTVIFTYDQIRTAASTWQRVLSVKKV